MSQQNDDDKKNDNPPLGAVLGWLNLSPTVPNSQDSLSGATAGLFKIIYVYCYWLIIFHLASPPRFIDYSQLMEANRNAQNLQLAHEIVFNKDFQLRLPEYDKGRLGKPELASDLIERKRSLQNY